MDSVNFIIVTYNT